MPRLDGTGPNGQGSMTGRGFGNCVTDGKVDNRSCLRGRIFGRGLRKCFFQGGVQNIIQEKNMDILNDRATYLKNELNSINKIIDSLKDL